MNEYQRALNNLPFDPDHKEKTIRMLKDHTRAKAEQSARPAWRRYAPVAVAACVAVILLGAGVLWPGRDTTPPPVAPDGGVTSVPTNTTNTTNVTNTTNTTNTTTFTQPPTTEPTPTTTQVPMGGDIARWNTWDVSLYGSADLVINYLEMDGLIIQEEYMEWNEQFYPEYKVYDPSSGKRPYDESSVYTFVRDFDVPREFLEEVNERYKEVIGYPPYSEEALDLIYGDDVEAFVAYFASPISIPVGNRVYCVGWLQHHTIEEWAEVGITKEDVEKRARGVWPEYMGYSEEMEYWDFFSVKVMEFCG